MVKNFILPLCYLILSVALTACGGGGSSGATGSNTSQTVSGTALDATGKPFAKGTDVLAVDANGNVASGKVKDDAGNFDITLVSVASSGKKGKELGGNIVLKVGAGSNSLTIVIPSPDGKGTIEINVNLVVSEASKQFLADLNLTDLFDKVKDAVDKGTPLSDADQQNLSDNQPVIDQAALLASVKNVVSTLLGASGAQVDFLTGSISTSDTALLADAFTATKTITSLITTSAGTGGSITANTTVLFNADATITMTPDTGFEINTLLVDGLPETAALSFTFSNVIKDHTIAATFKKKTYTITNTSGANGAISANSTVDHGSNVTVTMTPNAGFEIATLTVDGALVPASSTRTFTNVTSNHTVDVTYQLKSYLITTVAGANGTISASASVAHGSNSTITITPSSTFTVDTLTVDGAVVPSANSFTFTNVTATHSVSVTFKAASYSVTTTAGAGGTITAGSTVAPGVDVTVTMTPSAGFLIDVLTVDGVIVPTVSTYTFTAIAKNHTVAVTYVAGKTITTSAGTGGTISASSTVLSGSNVTVTITPNSGFVVDVLTVDAVVVASANTYSFNNVTANHSVSVTFIAAKTITSSAGSNGAISPLGATDVKSGASQTYTITPDVGYVVNVLTVDGSAVASATTYTFSNVTTTHTISVTFKLIQYTITTSAGANGTITGTVLVNHGTSSVVTITASATFVVSSLIVDGVSVQPAPTYTFSNVTANHSVVAAFAGGNVITATASTGGTISPEGDVPVVTGANQLFTMTPKTGYNFGLLTIDAGGPISGIATYAFLTVNATHSISATFDIKKYYITTSVTGGNGTITASATSDHFSDVTITMTPNSGYIVDVLTVDGVVKTPALTYTFKSLSAAHTVDVTYVAGYYITASKTGKGTISPEGVVSVLTGNDQAFTITPDEGYEATLNIDSSFYDIFDYSYGYTFSSVSATHTIDAVFTIKQYNINNYAYNYDEGAGVDGGTITASSVVNHFSNVTITITPDAGYVIDQILDNGNPVDIGTTYQLTSVDGNHDIYAIFRKGYTITASAGANGSISPSGSTTVYFNGSQEFEFTPNTGYVVDTVTIDGETFGAEGNYYDFYYVNDNHSIAVTFKKQQFYIYDSSGNYSGTNYSVNTNYNQTYTFEGEGYVDYGDDATVTVTARPGSVISFLYYGYYDEDNWTEVDVDITDPTTVSVTFANIQSDYWVYTSTSKDARFEQNNVLTLGAPASTTDFTKITGYTAIAAGYYHSVALKEGGNLVGWGYNNDGETNGRSNIKAISAGNERTLALTADGYLYEVGSINGYAPYWLSPDYDYNITAIAAGEYHSLALVDGGVIAWGGGWYGETEVPEAAWSDVTAIAGGEYFSLALKNDGTVVGWGYNDDGQVDIPEGLTNVIAIAAGEYHSLALKSDGTVVGWGRNYEGETDGSGLSGVVAIAAGDEFSVALKNDGTVVVWGNNTSNVISSIPEGLTNVIAISATYEHILALKSDGSIVSWGFNSNNQAIVPSLKVKSIVNGDTHIVALMENGTLKASGDNSYGQTTIPEGLDNVSKIAAGFNHTLALKANGEIIGWGDNSSNQLPIDGTPVFTKVSLSYHGLGLKSDGTVLGWGSYNEYGQATIPEGLTGVIDVSAGYYHSLALLNNGTVTAWGNNEDGQINVPEDLSNVTAISAGSYHSLALKADGTVASWGYNNDGETTTSDLAGITAITASDYYSLFLKSDGTVVQRGSGDGYLEDGVPAGLVNVTAIAAGYYHALALKNDGTVVSWGSSWSGEGETGGLTDVVAIGAGDEYSVALKADGTLIAWGYYINEELTDVVSFSAGLYNVRVVKTDGSVVTIGYNYYNLDQVVPKTYYKSIAAGKNHSVALTTEGKVLAWGNNSFGQSSVPEGLENVIDISAGENHTVALKSDGTVVVWGDNNFNQKSVPETAVGIIAISAGLKHTVALRSDGTLVIWGDNSYGQGNIPASVFEEQSISSNQVNTVGTSSLNGVIAIAAGGNHTVAQLYDGRAIAWGSNNQGQATIPVVLPPVKSISAGYNSTHLIFGGETKNVSVSSYYSKFGLKADGILGHLNNEGNQAYYDGDFMYGIKNLSAGNFNLIGLTSSGELFMEFGLDENYGFKDTTSGYQHGLGLKDNGTVIGFGFDDSGETYTEGRANVIAVSPGYYQSTILKSNGTVEAWGANENGQSNIPEGLSGVIAISSNWYHTLALKGDGTVVAWGYNGYGICNVPEGLSNVIAVTTSQYSSYALKSDGTVVGWGYSPWGYYPYGGGVDPESLKGIVAISAGDYVVMALKADGTIIFWQTGND